MAIEKNTPIEDLVGVMPEAVTYLAKQGIRCIRCGEPIWGTLEEAAKEKGFDETDIVRFVKELNHLAEKKVQNK